MSNISAGVPLFVPELGSYRVHGFYRLMKRVITVD